MKTGQILILAAGLVAAAGCTSTREQLGYAKPVKFNELPPAAQTTVRREVGNAPIKRITEETKYGRPAYRVEVTQAWVNPTLWVSQDGAIIKESNRLVTERSLRANEAAGAPAPAKQTPVEQPEPTPTPTQKAPVEQPAPVPAPSTSTTNTNSIY